MGSEPSHGAGLTSTGIRILLQEDDQCREGVNTDVDSADPFCLLLGTGRSPFFPNRWLCTGARTIRTRHAQRRPENCQSDRKHFVDERIWAKGWVNGGTDFGAIYCLSLSEIRLRCVFVHPAQALPVRGGRQH